MKRLLLVSYYFPPSGGPGVQRTIKFVKYLEEFGWEPTVLTVDPRQAAYPAIDESLTDDIPSAARVVRTRSWDPYGAYAALTGRRKSEAVTVSFSGESRPNFRQRLGRWIRANVFLPDARVGWVPFAVRRGCRLLDESHYDAVMTTGPPHSTHLIGRRLSQSYPAVPWLADFRDPWTGIDFSHLLPMSGVARGLDRSLERKVLSGADRVSIISPFLAAYLTKIYPRHYDVIMNGFDPEDFQRVPVAGREEFTISYMGSMDPSRDPESLWRALSTGDLEGAAVRVRLIGRVDPLILDSVARHGLTERVDVLDQIDHSEVTRLMCSSALLLLVINRTPLAAGIVPGKTFEYIGSGRPVIAVGPTDGDAAAVLREAGAGEMFDYDDLDGFNRYLSRHAEAWFSGRPLAGADAERAEAFSRRNRARQLASLLDELCQERSSG